VDDTDFAPYERGPLILSIT